MCLLLLPAIKNEWLVLKGCLKGNLISERVVSDFCSLPYEDDSYVYPGRNRGSELQSSSVNISSENLSFSKYCWEEFSQ